jgi:hypothetical protein
LFLRDAYTFYEVELLEHPCLLIADKQPGRTAATVRKHITQVKDKWIGDVIYVRTAANSDERRRLVEQRVPFIVPGNQMYLPMLGLDFREHFRRVQEETSTFSPATQAAVILLLTNTVREVYDTEKLADRLQYSKMTASRILNELRSAEIGVVKQDGRKRLLDFDGVRLELWKRALPLLNSPVTQTKYVRRQPHVLSTHPAAGLTALALSSMLAAPRVPTVALSADQWKMFRGEVSCEITKSDDPEATQIQVWSYAPKLFAREGAVDRWSLFLSLRDESDERVEGALEEMMETTSW